MRLALVLVLAACAPKASPGPAWPKTAERELDGGESLEPRTAAASTLAASTKDDDDDDKPVAPPGDKPSTGTPAESKSEAPKPADTTPRAPEDIIITTEEIVIEIDDD